MTLVPLRDCGADRIPVPALTIGSWHTWDRAVFEEVVTTLTRAVDAGASMFDVAVYRQDASMAHDSPTDLIWARAVEVAGLRREDYTLCIKGWIYEPEPSLTRQVDEALVRIGHDESDVLVLGDITREADFDADELVAEIAAILRGGKAKHWAVNNWSAEQVRSVQEAAARIGAAGPIFAQLKYGIARRSIAEGEPYRELIAETGLGIQSSSSFEGGLLLGAGDEREIAGDIGDIQAEMRGYRGRFAEAARTLGTAPATLAIAFPLANPNVASALAGVRTPAQLEELLAAFALLERHGAEAVRSACDDFWLDRGIVDPDASWAPVAHGTSFSRP